MSTSQVKYVISTDVTSKYFLGFSLSRDLDPVLDLLIGRHLILFFVSNSSKSVMAIPTASLVMVIQYISPVLSVSTACQNMIWLVYYGFRACPGSFQFCPAQKGEPLDPDKPGCIKSCETDPNFSGLVCVFLSLTPDFCNQT